MDEWSNKNHTKIEKRKKKREDKLQKRQKEAFNLVSVWVKTGRTSQTTGKNNNFCMVYFEEVVVANVLSEKSVTLETSQSPIGLPSQSTSEPSGFLAKQALTAAFRAVLVSGANSASTTMQPK